MTSSEDTSPATRRGGGVGAPQGTDRNRWAAFAVCVAVTGLTILDLTKVNVALPSIEAALGAGSTELQLVVSAYILAFGLALVPSGRIGDLRSRKKVLLVGVAVFLASSVVCALAPNVTVLVVGRLLQGLAGGMQVPQVMGMIQSMFQGRERGRAFGLFGAMIGLSTAFGPTIGGVLIALGGAQDGWRWVFWMNVPLFAVLFVFALRLLPENDVRGRGRIDVDPVGIVIFGLAIMALMTPFLLTTGAADDPPWRWATLGVFVVLVIAFLVWERRYAARGQQPLLALDLFRISSFRYGSLLMAFYFMGMPTTFLLTTLFLQGGLGLSALQAGLTTIGFALASAVSSYVGGNLVVRFERSVVVCGLALMIVALIGLGTAAVLVPESAAPWAIAAIMVVGGIGGGLVISPNQTLTVADVPPAQGGVAGSVGQLGQRVGNAIGISVGISLFYATIYRESGQVADVVAHHDAYATGLGAVAVFISAALVVAIIDTIGRRRALRVGGR